MTEIAIRNDIREGILSIEERLASLPGAIIGDSDICPLKHTFVDGAYVREIFMPKGMLITSKIHKVTHPYFVLKGECSVLTEEGVQRIKAPYYGVTKAGTKRILYMHEDTTWVTIHVTKEQEVEKIEEEIIAKSFDEIPGNFIDVCTDEGKLIEFVEEIKKGENT